MPKTQTKPSRWRRFFGWFGRHKIIAVVLVLVVAGLLYWSFVIITWNLQVRAERQRYVATASDIQALAQTFPSGGQTRFYRLCSYTSNGAVFATRSLGCQIHAYTTYSSVSLDQAKQLASLQKTSLIQKGVELRENKAGYDTHDLQIYTFEENQLSCGYFSTYYSSAIEGNQRDKHAPQSGDVLFMGISCSGPAKAEYFPVVQD